MTKEIPLTRGYVALVDDEDYEWLSQWKWRATTGHMPRVYARRTERIGGKRVEVRMHREVAKTPKGMHTDHINGNTLDNRKGNVRPCTSSENQMNVPMSRKNTSGYKGVRFEYKKWRARISVRNKKLHLGSYDTKEDAARAYDKAARELFGEFAVLNFPDDPIPNIPQLADVYDL